MLTVLASMLSGFVVMATPGAANAALIPCPTQNIEIQKAPSFTLLKHLKLVSSVATFDRTDSRSVDNTLDTPVSATFTSSNSSTFMIAATTTVMVQPTLLNFFKLTVSSTITFSKTTTIGVNVTATVPPHTRLIGEYGISSFDITYDTDVYLKGANNQCQFIGVHPRDMRHAPTDNEGWRLSLVGI